MPKTFGKHYHIPILSKALDVLEWLQAERQSASVEEIYQHTRFSKTSVYRILKTLEHRGYVARQDDGRFRAASRPSKLRFGFAGQSEELPFSQAVSASLREAAAASGVELVVLDNRYDARTAVENAERLVREQVDLVIEFQIDQSVAPIIADRVVAAGIPLIAVEIPHPHACFFGVDNFRVGFVAGECLGQFAMKAWKGKVSWVLGLDIEEAGSLVQSRITGAFEGVCSLLPAIVPEQFVRLDARGLAEKSEKLTAEFLQRHARDKGILIAAADDTTALGALRAVKRLHREKHVAVVGQDCLPEAVEEMKQSATAFIGSVSHEVHTYGPRLIQIGLALVRGQQVGGWHYVNHRLVTAEVVRSMM